MKESSENKKICELSIDELKEYINEDLQTLMESLRILSREDNEVYKNKIRELNEKKPNLNINLDGLSSKLNAYIYYQRFLALIKQLIIENKGYDTERIRKIIGYYIFENTLKELVGNGTSYYFNFRANMSKATLYRITEDLERDNINPSVLINKINIKVNSFKEFLINNWGYSEDVADYMAKIITDNNEKDIVKKWTLLCVDQVNGNKQKKLQSYSKSLGVVLFKYAHGKCTLIIRKNEDINCIKYKNHDKISFQLFDNSKKIWNKVEGICIDFSNVRDNKFDNINKWLNSLCIEEKNFLTYASPILDRHVVDTFRIDENNSKIISISDNTELILFYRAYILMFKEKELSKVKIEVFDECENWLNSMKNEYFKESSSNIIKAIEDIIKSINEIKEDFEKSNAISEKIYEVLNTVDWEKERYYFKTFIEDKENSKRMIEFLDNTEKSIIMKLIKGMFYYFDEYEYENKEKSEGE